MMKNAYWTLDSSLAFERVSKTVQFDRSLIAICTGLDVALVVPLKVTSLSGRMKGAAIQGDTNVPIAKTQ